MVQQNQKHWIVLVNKVPQGPFTEAEVKDQLNENKFRRNDVGMLVSSDGQQPLSGWKILWQFREFDRRLKKNQGKFLPPGGKERRKELSTPEIDKFKREKIPSYLLDIDPEDLLFGEGPRLNAEIETDIEIPKVDLSPPPAATGLPFGKIILAALLIAGTYFGYEIIQSSPGQRIQRRAIRPETVKRRSLAKEAPQAPLRKQSMPLANIKPRPRPDPPPQEFPEEAGEPDYGELAPEDFDELRDRDVEVNEMNRANMERRKRRRQQAAGLEDDVADEDGFYEEEEGFQENYDEEGFVDDDLPIPEDDY